MGLAVRAITGIGAIGAITFGGSAWAFNYPEHELLTRVAWTTVLAKHPEARSIVQDAFEALPQDHVCPGGGLGTSLDTGVLTGDDPCFTVADLPALAADHSESPAQLIERWLVPGDPVGSKSLRNLWAALVKPVSCPPSQPDYPAFISLIRRYAVPANTGGLDTAISAADGDYVCLAGATPDHFRLPGVAVNQQMTARSNNAINRYATYHAEALKSAQIARLHQGDTRKRLLAMALIYESFALHFLEDSVAAGHMVTPATRFNVASTMSTHDHANREGVEVIVDNGMCEILMDSPEAQLILANLTSFCARSTEPRAFSHLELRPVVHGDHAISLGITSRDSRDLTEGLAMLASYVSLVEFVQAATAPELAPLESKGAARPSYDGPPASREGFVSIQDAHEDRDLTRQQAAAAEAVGGCGAWLGEIAANSTTVRAMLVAAEEGWGRERCHYIEMLSLAATDGDFAALSVLPTAADEYAPTEVFSGTCARFFGAGRPIIRPGVKAKATSLHIGIGVCHYFPPFAGMRFATGADLLFYYFHAGGTTDGKPTRSAVPRPMGGQLWASIGFDPRRTLPLFFQLGVGFDSIKYAEPALPGVEPYSQTRLGISLIMGIGVDLALYDAINVRFAIPVSLIWTTPDPKDGRKIGMLVAPGLEAGVGVSF